MASAETKSSPAKRPETEKDTDQPWLWNVVLLDDDHHSYEYVMRMMQVLFAKPLPRAFDIAKRVDTQGRAVCLTTHREHAELKRDQILGFGPDKLIAGCSGSMSAVLEPAEFGDGDDEAGGGKDGGGSGGQSGGDKDG